MAYVNRPYRGNYYEAEREVVRDAPYGGAYADYRVDEYGNRVYHHHNALGNDITEVVSEVTPGTHYHHRPHHGRPAEIVERREGYIVDSAYDPYRRTY